MSECDDKASVADLRALTKYSKTTTRTSSMLHYFLHRSTEFPSSSRICGNDESKTDRRRVPQLWQEVSRSNSK